MLLASDKEGGLSVAKIVINEERCKGCELCVNACPRGILALADRFNNQGYRPVEIRDAEKCIGCKFCAIMCPDVVIEVYK
jgi:2-oxoglutarate ferredoxin oxidoreductase subunit delta